MHFWPEVEQTHEVGIVIRHSEHLWRDVAPDGAVKVIDFGSEDIDAVTRDILACRKIISSSLHGLVIADAYGIPNAWLGTDGRAGGSRPNGGEFKYLDYFASVNKLRRPHHVDLRGGSWIRRASPTGSSTTAARSSSTTPPCSTPVPSWSGQPTRIRRQLTPSGTDRLGALI